MIENALAGHGLVRTFEAGAGIRGVDIVVRPAEIHALVGLNGSGKSTLMRLLLGMLRPSSGTVAVEGRDVVHADWAAVGHLVEYPLAYAELTVRQNLELGARLHGVPARQVATTVEQIITELNLTHDAERRSGRLSLGNRQRLGLASALQHDPRIIVLDEPTNSLDPAGGDPAPRCPSQTRGRRRRSAREQPPPRRGRANRRPDLRAERRTHHRGPRPTGHRHRTLVLRPGPQRRRGRSMNAALATELTKFRRATAVRAESR